MRHAASRTGLSWREGVFVQDSEPFHLRDLDVFYADERVSRSTFTSAISDDPLIAVRFGHAGILRVRRTNRQDERFEALARVPVS